MREPWFPTEEELDILLPEPPAYDPEAVKRRTITRIGERKPLSGRRAALRGLCIAAVVCALSASALAVANYATQGGIAAAFRLKPVQAAQEPEEKPVQEAAPATAPPREETAPEELGPEAEEPAGPGVYEMDERVAAYLQVPETRQEELRPMGQELNLVDQAEGARMTVLQTLGDAKNLYVLLRVDFPKSFQLTAEMDFRRKSIELRNTDELSSTQAAAQHWEELERTEHSITYLATVGSSNGISSQTAVVTLEAFGRERQLPKQDAYVQVPAGRAVQCTFVPDETGYWAADTTAGSRSTRTLSNGAVFQIGDGSHDLFAAGWETALDQAGGALGCRWTDGVIAVLVKSDQDALVYLDGTAKTVSVTYGGEAADPSYEVLLTDSLTQSWVLDYQNVTRIWTVEAQREDGSMAEVGTLEVSPIAMNLDLIGSQEAQVPVERTKGAKQAVVLRFADGSEFTPPYFWEWWPELGLSIRSQFEQVIDPADVTGLTGFGMEFTLKLQE